MADKRINRIIDSIKSETTPELAYQIIETCGTLPPDASPAQQSKWTKKLIGCMDSLLDNKTRGKIMENCGKQCICKAAIEAAKEAKKASEDIDDFLRRLNETGWGGGNLKREGDIIRGSYDQCYCDIVTNSKEPMSPTYCNCSRAWYATLFEAAFNKPVEVKLISSFTSGGNKCVFEIKIPEASQKEK